MQTEPVLTDRQREVLVLVGEGLSTGEIGKHLGITQRTAKAHIDVLRHKYGVAHKRQLVPIGRGMQP